MTELKSRQSPAPEQAFLLRPAAPELHCARGWSGPRGETQALGLGGGTAWCALVHRGLAGGAGPRDTDNLDARFLLRGAKALSRSSVYTRQSLQSLRTQHLLPHPPGTRAGLQRHLHGTGGRTVSLRGAGPHGEGCHLKPWKGSSLAPAPATPTPMEWSTGHMPHVGCPQTGSQPGTLPSDGNKDRQGKFNPAPTSHA